MLAASTRSLRSHPAYRLVVFTLFLVTVVGLAVLVGDWFSRYRYGQAGTNDFIEYWSASQLLRCGENPYDVNPIDRSGAGPRLLAIQVEHGVTGALPVNYFGTQMAVSTGHPLTKLLWCMDDSWAKRHKGIVMWNPPWLLIWLHPILLLPFCAAALVWMATSLGLLLVSAAMIWYTHRGEKDEKDERDKKDFAPLSIALIASALFVPAWLALQMGQISMLLLLGAAGFVFFACRRRDGLAGAFLVLTSVKPHFVYLLLIAVAWWVIVERRWKVILGMAAVMLPTCAVLTILWPDWLMGYRAALAEPPVVWKTATIGTILRSVLPVDWPPLQFIPSLLLSIGLLGFLLLKHPPGFLKKPGASRAAIDWKTLAGPLLLLSAPTAAHGWGYDQVVLLLPYLTIIFWLYQSGERGARSAECGPAPLCAPRSAIYVVSALALIGIAMFTQNQMNKTGYMYFWVPWALAAVYLYAWCKLNRAAIPAVPSINPVFPTNRVREEVCQ